MVELLGAEIPVNLPSFGFGLGSTTWALVMVIILVLILGGVGIFLMQRYKLFNKKIVVFENISGQGYQPVYKDRARLIKLGDGGEEILFLMKKKIFRTAYGKKMGKNTYWFAIGQDGYWYNVVLGDVDAKLGMLDIEPIDRDMRYMHVAIRRNIADRYKKSNFMDKYGAYVMSGIFLMIMLVGIWLMLDKIAGISSNVAGSVDASEKVLTATEKIITALDNLKGGSGLVTAG